jgi:hypothetical protein
VITIHSNAKKRLKGYRVQRAGLEVQAELTQTPEKSLHRGPDKKFYKPQAQSYSSCCQVLVLEEGHNQCQSEVACVSWAGETVPPLESGDKGFDNFPG